MIETLEVIAGSNSTLLLGIPYDMQLDAFVVSEWGFSDILAEEDIPKWISFNNQTINEGIYLNITPATSDSNKVYNMFMTLTELDRKNP